MAPYLDENTESGESPKASCLYDLCAITVHKGTAMGGHYLAFGRNNVGAANNSGSSLPAAAGETGGTAEELGGDPSQRNSSWVCFNDANVHVLTEQEAGNLFSSDYGQDEVTSASDSKTQSSENPKSGTNPTSTETPATSEDAAPRPPAPKADPNTGLGSTYDVHKDAYLLIYRRRPESAQPAEDSEGVCHK